MFKAFKRLARGLGMLAAIPLLYYAAAFAGALTWPHARAASENEDRVEVVLLSTFLHADLALPVDSDLIDRFGFLRSAGIPLDHRDLRYLIFGWGSRDFYTTAGTYADVRPGAVFKALTGDSAVMHIYPAGDISKSPDARKIIMPRRNYARLVDHVLAGFRRGTDGNAMPVAGATFGEGDVFYEGTGHFNVFNPCNVWAAEGLKRAGIALGPWTPTAQSLRFSLWLSGR